MIIIRKRIKLTFILLTLLMIINAIFLGNVYLNRHQSSFNQSYYELEEKNYNLRFSGTYTNITIDDSPGSPNNWAWAKDQTWCSGNGTLLDPYIIENQVLNLSSSSHGIRITNSTSSYFIIKNNVIQWNMLANTMTMTGVYLSNATKGKIVTNTIYNITKGIHLINSSNVEILNNTIFDQTATFHMYEGILVEYSYFLDISKNKVYDIIQAGNGIFLNNSFFNNISDNKIYNIENSNGMKLENSNFNDFTENDIFNNEVGITLQDSHNNTFSRNNVSNNADHGLVINQSHNNTLTGNTVNDNSQYGIYLFESDNNTLSRNPVNNNGDYGIRIEESITNLISGNTANNDGIAGIYLYKSNHTNISENNVSGNNDGIYLEILCYYNIISENIMTGNQKGLTIYDNSNFNIITKNNASKNNDVGMYIEIGNNNTISENIITNNLQHGIVFTEYSDNNTFSGNKVNNNDVTGIYLENDCDFNQFTDNILNSNFVGFQIDLSNNNNSIFENLLLNNSKHAIDSGTDNNWNITTIGNYWDNHTGPDTTPNDGIVDVQYNISGTAGSVDYLPIAEDGAPRIMINSPSGEEVFGSSAPSFDVTITDNLLDSMWYTIDGGLNTYTFTANGVIDLTAWGMATEGNVTLTFYASDILGNIGTAEIVIVKDYEAPVININSPTTGEVFGSAAPSFNVRISDDYLDIMWYTLDGGLNNYTFTINGTLDQSAWNLLTDGVVSLTFYANDTLTHLASAEVIIEKDTQAPIITINSPSPGGVFGNNAPSFNVTVTDPNLDSIWLELDGSNYELSVPLVGTINQTAWTALPEGDYTITLHANDTAGNLASETVTITKNVPSGGGIGLDYFTTSFLVSITGGLGVIVVIVKIRSKKRVKFS